MVTESRASNVLDELRYQNYADIFSDWKELEKLYQKSRLGSTTLALSSAHDKARDLPPYRPERVEELLWDWACNSDDMDIKKVMAELKHLYHEQEAEERRKEWAGSSC